MSVLLEYWELVKLQQPHTQDLIWLLYLIKTFSYVAICQVPPEPLVQTHVMSDK